MDVKAAVVKSLQNSQKMFLQDLEAIPDEAFTQSFGPKARTVADIVYEINQVNDHIGLSIRGEEAWEWVDDGWIKAPADFAAKQTVIDAFKASMDKMIQTAENFSPEEIEGTIQTEHGERTRFQQFQFVCLHNWYHSGQLNFIQTLLGDDEWHWN